MAATAAAVAKSLVRNRKSLPQIIRAQILGRSGTNINVNNVAKDHQIVSSLFLSNQKLHAQFPLFGFGEMGSLLGPSPWLSPVEKADDGGMRDMVVEARGKSVEEEDDGEVYDDDDDDGEVYDDGDDDEFYGDDGFGKKAFTDDSDDDFICYNDGKDTLMDDVLDDDEYYLLKKKKKRSERFDDEN